tara:strand:- start:94890 stop:100319 length:5430 start_codon:yes stop_codon:yes gene_type:complete
MQLIQTFGLLSRQMAGQKDKKTNRCRHRNAIYRVVRRLTSERLEPRFLLNASDLANPAASLETVSPLASMESPTAAMASPSEIDPTLLAERAAAMALVPLDNVDAATVASGSWSDPTIWNSGRVPTEGENVQISPDHLVTLDGVRTERLRTLRIDGTLQIPGTQPTTLVVDTIVNTSVGRFEVGSELSPVSSDVDVKIVFTSPEGANQPIDRSWDPNALSRGMIGTGSVSIWGDPKTGAAFLSGDHAAGSNVLSIDTIPEDWRVNDRLVISGTDFDPDGDHDDNSVFQDEVILITAIDRANSEIRFQRDDGTASDTLRFTHAAPPRLDASGDAIKIVVINLSRNVVFESEDWQSPGFLNQSRGHVMLGSKDVSINGAGFYGLGRSDKSAVVDDPAFGPNGLIPGTGTNPRGRYSLHLHRNGADDVGADEAEVNGNAIWDSPGWGVVVHDSRALVRDNVSFDIVGAHFVAEDGNEVVQFDRNVAIKSSGGSLGGEKPHEREGTRDRGFAGHGFWFESPYTANGSNDNIAVSHASAAYFIWGRLDQKTFLADIPWGNLSPEMQSLVSDEVIEAWKVPVEDFSNNAASNSLGALELAGALRDDTGADEYGIGHGQKSVIEQMTGWNLFGYGIGINYASRTVITEVVMLGDLDDPIPVGPRAEFDVIDGFGLFQMKNSRLIEIENSSFEGFYYGITLGQTGGQGLNIGAEPPIGATKVSKTYLANHTVAFAAADGRTGNPSGAPLIVDNPPFTPSTQLDQASVIVPPPGNVAPEARFTAEVISETVVRFDASLSNDPDSSIQWSDGFSNDLAAFGWDLDADGIIDRWGEVITHRFSSVGTYPVQLFVFDRQGAVASSAKSVDVIWTPIVDLFAPGNGDFSAPIKVESEGSSQVTGHWGDGWYFGAQDWSFDAGLGAIVANSNGGDPGAYFVVRDMATHQDIQNFQFDFVNIDGNGRANNTDIRVYGINGSQYRFSDYKLPELSCLTCDTSMTELYEVDNLPTTGPAPESVSVDLDLGTGFDFLIVGLWSDWSNNGDTVRFSNFELKNDSILGPNPNPIPEATIAGLVTTMVEGATADAFRVSLSSAADRDTLVRYNIGGDVSGADLTNPLVWEISIPAGDLFADVPIQLIDDTEFEPPETLSISLDRGTGYRLGAASVSTLLVVDNDERPPATIAVTELVASIAEGVTADAFRLSFSEPTPSETDVSYRISGDVQQDDLSSALVGTITIPAGQTSWNVPLEIIDDIVSEPTELLMLEIVSANGYVVGNPAFASLNVLDNDQPPQTVVDFRTIAPGDASGIPVSPTLVDSGFVFRDGGPGQTRDLYLFGTASGFDSPMLRSKDYLRNISVYREDGAAFDITSFDFAATNNEFWGEFDATVTGHFADGTSSELQIASQSQASQTLTLRWQGVEKIVIDFRDGPAGHRYGMVGNFVFASGPDVPVLPIVTVDALLNSINEGATADAFRLSLGEPALAPVQINYRINGDVSDGDISTSLSGSVTIAAGASYVDVPIITIDDDLAESTESLVFSIASGTGYQRGTPATASIGLIDNDQASRTVVDFTGIAPDGSQGVAVGRRIVDSQFVFEDSGPGMQRDLFVFGVGGGFDTPMLRSKDYLRSILVYRVDGAAFDMASFDYAATGDQTWEEFDAIVTGFFIDGSTRTVTVLGDTKKSTTASLNWNQLDRIVIDFCDGTRGHRYGMVGNFVFASEDAPALPLPQAIQGKTDGNDPGSHDDLLPPVLTFDRGRSESPSQAETSTFEQLLYQSTDFRSTDVATELLSEIEQTLQVLASETDRPLAGIEPDLKPTTFSHIRH